MDALFKYEIRGSSILYIEDIGHKTNKSVTNDIENVLRKLVQEENLSLKDYIILYKDSDDIIDGIFVNKDNSFRGFYHIGERDFEEAKRFGRYAFDK